MIITSLDNNKIKDIAKLNTKKYRKESNKFLVEGDHLVIEAFKSGRLDSILLVNDIDIDVPKTFVTTEIMKKISDLESTPNVIGVCNIEEKNCELGPNLLLLDKIQDPGNLGTIIRSAVAFNIDTIVLGTGTVDIYNSKSIRATQGMMFHINIIERDLITLIPELQEEGYHIYATDVVDGTNLKNVTKHSKNAIIIGNEGNGVDKSIMDLSDEHINIPMNKECESLNVGVATSIILYELSAGDL